MKTEHRPSKRKTLIWRRWVKTWLSPCCNHRLTVLQSLQFVPSDWVLLVLLVAQLEHHLQTLIVLSMVSGSYFYGCESVQTATKNWHRRRTLPTAPSTSKTSRQTWFSGRNTSRLNSRDGETEEMNGDGTTRGREEKTVRTGRIITAARTHENQKQEATTFFGPEKTPKKYKPKNTHHTSHPFLQTAFGGRVFRLFWMVWH